MQNWSEKTLLVAEDEMSNYLIISAMLEETGIQITHAWDGRNAVELYSKQSFDLIMMDIKMPYMDGFEATSEIRKMNPVIPIIAQTAYAYKREECIEAGFTDYISKPFSEKQLIGVIQKYIGAPY